MMKTDQKMKKKLAPLEAKMMKNKKNDTKMIEK